VNSDGLLSCCEPVNGPIRSFWSFVFVSMIGASVVVLALQKTTTSLWEDSDNQHLFTHLIGMKHRRALIQWWWGKRCFHLYQTFYLKQTEKLLFKPKSRCCRHEETSLNIFYRSEYNRSSTRAIKNLILNDSIENLFMKRLFTVDCDDLDREHRLDRTVFRDLPTDASSRRW
jgi:hypothetical protein